MIHFRANSKKPTGSALLACSIFICFTILMQPRTFSQQHFVRTKGDHRAGFLVSLGGQSLLDVRYRYLTTALAGEYQYTLFTKGSWGVHGMVQPHIVFTRFNVNDGEPLDQRGFEFGTNLGLILERNFTARGGALYAGVSSGPHFLQKETHRQTSGPIFSSALFIGYAHQITRHMVIDIRPGYRHISNAGIYIPNGGINNSTMTMGLYYHF
jgi:hypothetical protein